MRRNKRWMLGAVMSLTLLISACGSNEAVPDAAGEEKEEGLTKVTQVTNWFAEAEHGGQYAALQQGFYEEAGLDMTIQMGGPQVSGIQLVASGKVQFAMAHADEVLMARSEGIDIVAIMSLQQINPLGFIYHNENKLEKIEDLSGKTTYILPGQPFWTYVMNKYQLTGVKEVAYTGSMANFILDKTAYTQGYTTNEMFALEEEGIDVGSILIADATGYNPYSNMLVTTGSYIEEHPEVVQAYVDASLKGWEYYKTNSEDVHPFMQTYNPDASLEWLRFGAEKTAALNWTGDAEEHGFGYMAEERWQTLADQMLEGKLLDEPLDVSEAYTTEFIN